MKNEKYMRGMLYGLRFVVILSILFTIWSFFSEFRFWKIYFYLNAGFILSYVWFNYIRMFYYKFREKKYLDSDEGYSIVVPSFNEEPRLLKECVKSIVNGDNNKKEIIIVDDGSSNNIWKTMLELNKKYPEVMIHKFKKNKGKRFTHEFAFKNSKYDYLISIDSDTILEKDAIRKLLAPFVDKKIGATTGNVLIKNEKKNLLTRIQAGLYWVGLNIYKRGQSTQGNVVCCSGCLSAYRRTDLMEILDEYLTQTYMGLPCGASEDRYLTNLMNERNKKVVYVEDSICYTEAPERLRKFIKQQIRWKRGFYRECLYTATYSWKTSKILFIENLLWLMLSPIVILPTVLISYFIILTNPLHFIVVALPFTILFAICRDSLFFIREPKKAFFYLSYIILYLFVLYPLNVYAIFNSNPEKWGTR